MIDDWADITTIKDYSDLNGKTVKVLVSINYGIQVVALLEEDTNTLTIVSVLVKDKTEVENEASIL